jgi:hypothetical protein
MSSLSRPIFIVGCPRSGTTLVQCILSASSRAFSLPETHFFSYVLPYIGSTPATPIGHDQIDSARDAFEHEAGLKLPVNVWAELDNRTAIRALDIFLAVVEHFRPAPGLRAIEKTPLHIMHLDTIAEAFPDAVLVNVVRDPIDVVSSLLDVPWQSSRSTLSHAQRWLESIQAARVFSRAYPGRLRTIVYERLVRDPEMVTRDLCAFVDLPFETAMLEEFGGEGARNFGRNESWKRDILSGVIVDRKGVWRTRMNPGQAWLVAQSTQRRRREYGYLDQPVASAASIVTAIITEARVRFREARSSTGVVGAARHAGSVLKTLSAA